MATIKVIQVNVYKGRFLDDLVLFLKKENPDFITMQEVTVSRFNLCRDKSANLFEIFKEKLEMQGAYNGDLKLKGDPSSFFGNAVFSKHEILEKEVLVLKKFRPVTVMELDGNSGNVRELIDRHILEARVNFMGRDLHVISWHGAWTAPPQDTPETMRQANEVARYLESLSAPFILGGDLNNVAGTKTIGSIEKIAVNLMAESGIKQTTHPKIHKIVPRGYQIDYIFTSRDFKLISIESPAVTVSDHLPLVAKLEI